MPFCTLVEPELGIRRKGIAASWVERCRRGKLVDAFSVVESMYDGRL